MEGRRARFRVRTDLRRRLLQAGRGRGGRRRAAAPGGDVARLEIRAGPGRHVRQPDGAEESAARRARGPSRNRRGAGLA